MYGCWWSNNAAWQSNHNHPHLFKVKQQRPQQAHEAAYREHQHFDVIGRQMPFPDQARATASCNITLTRKHQGIAAWHQAHKVEALNANLSPLAFGARPGSMLSPKLEEVDAWYKEVQPPKMVHVHLALALVHHLFNL